MYWFQYLFLGKKLEFLYNLLKNIEIWKYIHFFESKFLNRRYFGNCLQIRSWKIRKSSFGFKDRRTPYKAGDCRASNWAGEPFCKWNMWFIGWRTISDFPSFNQYETQRRFKVNQRRAVYVLFFENRRDYSFDGLYWELYMQNVVFCVSNKWKKQHIFIINFL